MKIVVLILTIYTFFYSISYANYEIKNYKNRLGANIVRFLGLFQLIFTNAIIFIF